MPVIEIKTTKKLFHLNNNVRLLKIANDVKPMKIEVRDREIFNKPIAQ